MKVPEMYFSECIMVAPEGNATNKDALLDEVTTAYVLSAEKVADCNILRRNGLELQRKLEQRIIDSSK